MAYRQYLVNNTDTIINNNLNSAAGNCSNMLPLMNNQLPLSPILFTSITQNPSQYSKPSDLLDNFLNKYIKTSTASTSGVLYLQ